MYRVNLVCWCNWVQPANCGLCLLCSVTSTVCSVTVREWLSADVSGPNAARLPPASRALIALRLFGKAKVRQFCLCQRMQSNDSPVYTPALIKQQSFVQCRLRSSRILSLVWSFKRSHWSPPPLCSFILGVDRGCTVFPIYRVDNPESRCMWEPVHGVKWQEFSDIWAAHRSAEEPAESISHQRRLTNWQMQKPAEWYHRTNVPFIEWHWQAVHGRFPFLYKKQFWCNFSKT